MVNFSFPSLHGLRGDVPTRALLALAPGPCRLMLSLAILRVAAA